MNDRQLLDQLATEDTFHPDAAMPSTAWADEVAFAEVERLIDAPDHPSPLTGRVGRRNGWLVAAAAFVAVVLLGAVAFLTSNADDDGPVATTTVTPTTTTAPPPTTTTQAPVGAPVAQETQLVLDALERAYNRADRDAVDALIATGASVSLAPGVPTLIPSAGSLQQRAGSSALYEERLRFEDCELFDNEVVCQVELTDDFSRILGLDPWVQTWQIVVTDGLIARVDVTGDDRVRAAAMTDFEAFVADRTGEPRPGLLTDELEWNRTLAGQAVYEEWFVLHTALASGVPEEAFVQITELHDAFNAGDITAVEALLPSYRPIEVEDVLSASVYFGDEVPSVDRAAYFTLWYDWLNTDWEPIGCTGDAAEVTCTVESRGLMTLFFPGGATTGEVTYTFDANGIASVLDRTVRTGGSGDGLENGPDLRGFWRDWMPANAPDDELLWPEGNGDPVNGYDLQFARAVLEHYPRFLAERGVEVPAEYLDGTVLDALPEG